MPNKQHRYKEVLRDFECAGLTLSPSRYWTEVPVGQAQRGDVPDGLGQA